jgi:homoserine kinase
MPREDPELPSALAPPVGLCVPASTSNLGPGFDLLGLALGLELEIEVLGPAREHERTRHGSAREWPEDPHQDLFLSAFDAAHAALGGRGRYRFAIDSAIPTARGLGASGAAVAAGLLLGAALAPRAATRTELLALGIPLEGHPDNVAASLFGGCTLCHPDPDGRGPLLLRQGIASSIGFALAWPEARLTTESARAVLPQSVPFADALENPRRLALLLEGLRTGDARLLAAGGEDRLHVPHRLPLIAGAAEALRAARAAGAWLATISGSGSALIALCAPERAAEIARALAGPLGAGASARALAPAAEAPLPRAL